MDVVNSSWDGPNERPNLVTNDNNNNKTANSQPAVVVPPDLSNMSRFLESPLPKQCGVVQVGIINIIITIIIL